MAMKKGGIIFLILIMSGRLPLAPPGKMMEPAPFPIFAFYYPWYQNPEVSGQWGHWRIILSEEQMEMMKQDSEKAKKLEFLLNNPEYRHALGIFLPDEMDYSALDDYGLPLYRGKNHPTIGLYDSSDPLVIQGHLRLAARAGITAFIVSWWGRDDFSNQVLKTMLSTAAKINSPVFLTVYYEQTPALRKEETIEDLLYILKTYGDEEKFLRREGKPVIFIYGRAMNQFNAQEWAEILKAVKSQKDAYFFADTDSTPGFAEGFDGFHIYNPANRIKDGKDMHDFYSSYMREARRGKKSGCLTVIPGYDDTLIRSPGTAVPRRSGALYRYLWQSARDVKPDCVLITSWNEWHEGSEIEPSFENGRLYLDITAEMTGVLRQP